MESPRRYSSSSEGRGSVRRSSRAKSNELDFEQMKKKSLREKEKYKNSSIPVPKGEKVDPTSTTKIHRKSSSSSKIQSNATETMNDLEEKFKLLQEKEKTISDYYMRIDELIRKYMSDSEDDKIEKIEEKPEEKSEERPEKKPEEKSPEKPEEEPEMKPEKKPEKKPEEKAEEKPDPNDPCRDSRRNSSDTSFKKDKSNSDILSDLEVNVQQISNIWLETSTNFTNALKTLKNTPSPTPMDFEVENVKIHLAIKRAKSQTLLKTRIVIDDVRKLFHHREMIRGELEKLLNKKNKKCGRCGSIDRTNEEGSDKRGDLGTGDTIKEEPEDALAEEILKEQSEEGLKEQPRSKMIEPSRMTLKEQSEDSLKELPRSLMTEPSRMIFKGHSEDVFTDDSGSLLKEQPDDKLKEQSQATLNVMKDETQKQRSSITSATEETPRRHSKSKENRIKRFSFSALEECISGSKKKTLAELAASACQQESSTESQAENQPEEVPLGDIKDFDQCTKELAKKNETITTLNNKIFKLQKTLNEQAAQFNELQVRLTECQEKIKWNQVLWKQIGKLKDQIKCLQQSNKQLEVQKRELECKMSRLDQEMDRLIKMNDLLNKKKFLLDTQEYQHKSEGDVNKNLQKEGGRNPPDEKAVAEKQNTITQLQTILCIMTDQKNIAQQQISLYQTKIEELEQLLGKNSCL